MKTVKELRKKLVGVEGVIEENLKLDELVGKKIIVIGSKEAIGDYGSFRVMKVKLNNKVYSVSVSSDGIVKFLDLDTFPFEATVIKKASKKRKGKFYYAFE